MKRSLVLSGLAGLLCIPALASGQAGVGRYAGDFDGQPDSKIKIDVALADGESVISAIKAKNFALTCEGAVSGVEGSATLVGEVSVRASGSFKVSDDNGDTTFKTRGTVKGNKTVGTFRFFGAVDGSDGVERECDSGRLSFVAR